MKVTIFVGDKEFNIQEDIVSYELSLGKYEGKELVIILSPVEKEEYKAVDITYPSKSGIITDLVSFEDMDLYKDNHWIGTIEKLRKKKNVPISMGERKIGITSIFLTTARYEMDKPLEEALEALVDKEKEHFSIYKNDEIITSIKLVNEFSQGLPSFVITGEYQVVEKEPKT